MNEFSRNTFPSGGWQWYQSQTGWSAPTPLSSTFNQTVTLIIKHRLANPAITAKHNLSTDPEVVGNELEQYTRKRLGILGASAPPKTVAQRLMPDALQAAVAGVKRTASGAALLMEWEESGLPPVSPGVSEIRASICLSCKKNGKGDFTRWFTVPASEMMKKRIQRLHHLNLKTPYDDNLGTCEVCLCPLKLKAHTPLELVLKHLQPEARAELPDFCWILREEAAHTSNASRS